VIDQGFATGIPADADDFVGGALPEPQEVTFEPGDEVKNVKISVAGDTEIEPNEMFTVRLQDPVGADVGINTADGIILNDDEAAPELPELSIAADLVQQLEGNTGDAPATLFTFTVTRTGDLSQGTTVEWDAIGSGDNPAGLDDMVAGSPIHGVATFTAQEETRTITLKIQGDTDVEPDQGLTVTLSNPIQATINEDLKAASTTITDDDANDLPPPELSIRVIDAHKDEGDEGTTEYTFLVERTGDAANLDQVTTVNWTTTGSGSRWADGADFVLGSETSGVLTFEPSDINSSQEITLSVQGDGDLRCADVRAQ